MTGVYGVYRCRVGTADAERHVVEARQPAGVQHVVAAAAHGLILARDRALSDRDGTADVLGNVGDAIAIPPLSVAAAAGECQNLWMVTEGGKRK